MLKDGESPPEPIADRHFSGKFLVRLTPETHRALALRAAEEGVSLNRLVSAAWPACSSPPYVNGSGGCQNLLVSFTSISSTHLTQS